MLTKFHKVLIGALVVQIALAVVLFAKGGRPAPAQEHALLPGFDAAKVTRLQVFSEDKPIDLVKKGDAWVVASSFDYPADKTKIDAVLAPIAKLAAAEPVAESKSRHKQLGVADDGFKRKLVITADGKDTTLFVGGSAGLRRNAVRLAGSDDVYGVAGLSEFSAPATVNLWVDPHYYAIPKDQIAEIRVEDYVFTHKDDGTWTATYKGEAIEPLDTDKLEPLIDQMASVDVLAPAALDQKKTGTFTIQMKGAAPISIGYAELGDKYWIHHEAMNRAVTIDKSKLEVIGFDRAKLVKAK